MQRRLGNRGAMAFAEQAGGAHEAPAEAGRERESPNSDGRVASEGLTVAEVSGPPAPEKEDAAEAPSEGLAEVARPSDEVSTEVAASDGASDEGGAMQAPPGEAHGSEAGPVAAPAASDVAQVTIDASSPGGIIEQIAEVPPTQSIRVYGQAKAASAGALGKQAEKAQQRLPEMPAPTGISPVSLADAGKDVVSKAERAPQQLDGAQTGRDTQPYPTAVDVGPPAPRPAPTVLRGGDDPDTQEADRELAISAQRAFERIGLSTRSIPSHAGARPGVDMTGDADPGQMVGFESSSNEKVAGAATRAKAGSYADFGEHDIFPAATDEILRSEHQLSARGAEGGALDPLQISPEIASALDQSVGPVYRDRVGVKRDEYHRGEEDYERKSDAAHRDAHGDIQALETQARNEQMAQRQGAQSMVTGYRKEWRESLDAIDADYRGKAGKARKSYRGQIEKARIEGETKADGHLRHAEQEAAKKKRKAEAEVRREKQKKRKKSGGFWGWARRAASAFVDALKKAVNFIWDKLREAIKGLFKLAKKLVLAAIEFARKAIVGLIKAFGAVLKGLVTIALIAFPEAAERVKSKIDGAVNTAVDGVNWVADKLKKGVAAILDFLANTIDSLLGLIQSLYNGILTVIGMIIRGEFKELMEKLGNLVTAARGAPSKFEIAAKEELLGDLQNPLSPEELLMAGVTPPGMDAQGGGAGAGQLPTAPWTKKNVGVDAVEHNMQLSPELMAALIEDASGGQYVHFGESDDKSRTMSAIMGEVKGAPGTASKQPDKNPPDGLSPSQRADIRWKLMKRSLNEWWQRNKVAIIAGTVAAIVGVVAAIIVTGGSILAAIPPIMSVLGPIFIGATIAAIGTRVRDYVSKSWAGDIVGGSLSLAKALAAGAVELVSYVTFKAGGALLKGGKALVKAGAKATRSTMAAGRRALTSAGKYVVSKGRVLFKGIAGSGIGKRARSFRDLGNRLLSKTRFRGFRISLKGMRFEIEGYVNPWILLATGEVKKISQADLTNLSKRGKTARVGHKVMTKDGKGIVLGSKSKSIKTAAGKTIEAPKGKLGRKLFDLRRNQRIKKADRLKQLGKEYKKLDEAKGLKARRKLIKGKSDKSTRQLRKGIGDKPHPANFEAHHVIPEELMGNRKVMALLKKINFDFQNGARNGVLLPKNPKVFAAFKQLDPTRAKKYANATMHSGSHPNYTKRVEKYLEKLADEVAAGTRTPASANRSIKTYQTRLRNGLMNGTEKLK
ncbi:MAG: AHH domain-containing protein [Pseudomonadota bacterium]